MVDQKAQAEASLASAKADFQNAKANFDRYKPLFESQAISKQQYDDINTRYEVATAAEQRLQPLWTRSRRSFLWDVEGAV